MAHRLPDYSPGTCMFCRQPLQIITGADTEPDSDSEQTVTVIDDVELYCGPPTELRPNGHHAHWTCLIDHARQPGAMPIRQCAVCGQNTLDPSGRFLVDVRNEGGETKGFDFGVILEEELFLDAHPNQIHVRAFHDLVAGGDYVGAIELIAEHDVDVNSTYGTDGLTALQKATFSGDTSGVEFLKSLGASM